MPTTLAFTLVSEGTSDYVIILPENPSEVESFAAEELQQFLEEISGARLPIIVGSNDSNSASAMKAGITEKAIILGANYDEALGKDGFCIQTRGSQLTIDGHPDRGILYGVYGFLEDYLGCRWYTSEVSYIPEIPTITLYQIDDMQIPNLTYREVYYTHLKDNTLAARLKLNGNVDSTQEKHPGYGTWCHTFFTYVPPTDYFASNPEYFSRRFLSRKDDGQLCLANPEVLSITVEKLGQMIEEQPNEKLPPWVDQENIYWDVSQMDNPKRCQCFNCVKLNMQEGTPMGSILPFVNQVAEQFPDKIISTLAYWYSEEPPKNIKPAENVSIMLCPISIKRDKPLYESTASENKKFVQNIEGWSAISNRLFIWDYVIGFKHLLMPFPNLFVQQENIKFFVDNHAKGIFSQGNREIGGEFAELRAYLLAKLLWNPNEDVETIINDFLTGYYGDAAPYIREYIDTMQASLVASGKSLAVFDEPKHHKKGYLSEKMIAEYHAILDKAEATVAEDPKVLARVEAVRKGILYSSLVLKYGTPEERRIQLEKLYELMVRDGVTRVHEWDTTPEEFYELYKTGL